MIALRSVAAGVETSDGDPLRDEPGQNISPARLCGIAHRVGFAGWIGVLSAATDDASAGLARAAVARVGAVSRLLADDLGMGAG